MFSLVIISDLCDGLWVNLHDSVQAQGLYSMTV